MAAGRKTGGRKPGSKNKLIPGHLKHACKTWNNLKEWVEGLGIEKCICELHRLKGQQYVYAYLALTEYVKPKAQRTPAEEGPKQNNLFATMLESIPIDVKLQLMKAIKEKQSIQDAPFEMVASVEPVQAQTNEGEEPGQDPVKVKIRKPSRRSTEALTARYSHIQGTEDSKTNDNNTDNVNNNEVLNEDSGKVEPPHPGGKGQEGKGTQPTII